MHALPLGLALALLGAPELVPPGAHADPELADVGRFIDLRGLDLAAPPARLAVETIALLPLAQEMPRPGEDPAGTGVLESEWNPSEAVLTIFTRQVAEGITSVDFVEPGVLYMEASEEVHAQFQGLVDQVEAVLRAAPRIRVTRFRAEDGAAVTGAPGAWRSFASEGATLMQSVTLAPGSTTRVLDLVAHSAMVDLDVQIAQASAIGQPQMRDLASGLDLFLEGTWCGDALRLAYVARATERRDRKPVGIAGVELVLAHETRGIIREQTEGWYEEFGLAGGSIAGETLLRKGQATVLSTRPGCFVAIELVSDAPAVTARTGTEGMAVMALSRDAFTPAGLSGGGPALRSAQVLEVPSGSLGDTNESPLSVSFEDRGPAAAERLQRRVNADQLDLPGATVLLAPDARREELEEGAAFLLGQGAGVHSVEASWSAGGTVIGSGAFEVLDGTQAFLALGEESFVSKVSEVEVAQKSAVRDPVVAAKFDGLVLELKLQAAADGSLSYAVQGQVSHEHGRTESRSYSGLAVTETSRLMINERSVQPALPTGPHRITLGDRSGQGLQVELLVKKLR